MAWEVWIRERLHGAKAKVNVPGVTDHSVSLDLVLVKKGRLIARTLRRDRGPHLIRETDGVENWKILTSASERTTSPGIFQGRFEHPMVGTRARETGTNRT